MNMNRKIVPKLIAIIKCIAFLCLISVLLARFVQITMNKQELFCSATLKQYEENSIEVLFLGSSQMVYAAQPMLLWEKYGITSYNMATSATTIAGNYWGAEIAFETQNPKVVVIDCTFAYLDTKAMELPRLHSALDGFWPSAAAYQAVNDLVDDPDERFEFYWPPYIYHTRWKELSKTDFIEVSDHGSGGSWLVCNIENFDNVVRQYDKSERTEVPSINLEYLEKLKNLCEENASELVLVVLPIPMAVEYQPIYNSLEQWAKERGIAYVNGYDDPEFWHLDYGTDFQDFAHMNIHGVKKSSAYIGDYLVSHYDLTMCKDEQVCAFWDERMKEYQQYEDDVWTYPLLSYGSAITFDADGNQDQFYGGNGGSDRELDSTDTFTWTTGPRTDFYFYIDEFTDARLNVSLEAVQPVVGKSSRTVDIYINEQYVSTLEIEATMEPTAFSIEIGEDLWINPEEQKLTFKYPDQNDAVIGSVLLDHTLGLKEITLERK